MVTSSAPGAAVLLDAETTPRPTPLITELPPGPHTIRVTANNHLDETRQVEVAAGAITALDLPLREKPATLLVTSVDGARVTLDGRLVGEAPLAGPLELPSGEHDLRVQRPGYTTYSNRFLVAPGGRLTLDAPLAMTLQRRVSLGLLTGGGAAIAAGVVLGGVSLAQQADAAGIKSRMDRGEVVCRGQDCPDLDRYNSAVATRDTLRTGAFTLAGIGTVAAGAGLLYYLLDGVWPFAGPQDSTVPAPTSPADRRATSRPRLLGAPVIAPDFGGLAISGQF
jgi:PEGA domain